MRPLTVARLAIDKVTHTGKTRVYFRNNATLENAEVTEELFFGRALETVESSRGSQSSGP